MDTSVSPIIHVGAKPVLVDVDVNTWCIDTRKIREAITKNTKAIMAVHIYGNMCNMDELSEISKEFNIPVIEDSAEAIGSEWNSKKAGSMGAYGTFHSMEQKQYVQVKEECLLPMMTKFMKNH